jgi:hypothetical protein
VIVLLSFLTLPFVLLAEYHRPLAELMTKCIGDNCIVTQRPWFEAHPTVFGTCLLKENATDPDCFR